MPAEASSKWQSLKSPAHQQQHQQHQQQQQQQQKKPHTLLPALILVGVAFVYLVVLTPVTWMLTSATKQQAQRASESRRLQLSKSLNHPGPLPAAVSEGSRADNQTSSVATGPRFREEQEITSRVTKAETPAAEAGKGADPCGLAPLHVLKLPPWRPPPGRYFLAWCQLFGWTNRLYCTERALILAAALNRTLIVPSIDVCVNTTAGNTMDLLVDVRHIRRCLLRGRQLSDQGDWRWLHYLTSETTEEDLNRLHRFVTDSVGSGLYAISLEEYLMLHNVKELRVDLLMCQGHQWDGYCPSDRCSAAHQIVNPPSTDPPFHMYNASDNQLLTMGKIALLQEATKSAEVLSFGDTFYANIDSFRLTEWETTSPLFETPCHLLFKPSRDVFSVAERFIKETFEGLQYAALHWRRKDFESFCPNSGRCSFWSIQQSAVCVAEDLKRANISNLFVATDAYNHEFKQLKVLLEPHGVMLHLFRPATRRSYFESSLVEKVVCAHSQIFIYQEASTFSYHVRQLRDGLILGRCKERALCYGRKARFVVGPEWQRNGTSD